MHKITKGLKKKKKGKKSKNKDEELFKPEELAAYRREHHQQANDTTEGQQPPADNEEWKKFNALTAGIDDILKKTQGDLTRIKSTSFFRREPPPSEVKKKEEDERQEELAARAQLSEQPPAATVSAVEAAIVQVSESESEEEDEDDIFDTTYIDAIASGEIKLAYIPESPTDQPEGDDPFDTSIAERAILGPNVERKGKKLVALGAAVEILTGRVQATTCVPTKRPTTRRQILKERDLLLGSFEETPNETRKDPEDNSPEVKTTLLDEDAPEILANEPIDLSKSLHLTLTQSYKEEFQESQNKEFEPLRETVEEEDEFSLLAVESLTKKSSAPSPLQPSVAGNVLEEENSWNAFDQERFGDDEIVEADPFDTAFAENILPGKAELKLIENEILNVKEVDFSPKKNELLTEIRQKVSIHITNPTGERESVSSLDRVSEAELCSIKPIHRDLLGGSSTDLSQLGDQPLKPKESIDEDYIEYGDPFDTSAIVEVKPGQTELKFLEKEFLSDIKGSLSDDDFDPRAEEEYQPTAPQPRKVSFDLPLNQKEDLIANGKKPLTPYYVRENSIPEIEETDPFDTSFVPKIAPGKVELKLIESELFEVKEDTKNFVTVQKLNLKFKEDTPKKKEEIDLLDVENDVTAKVLTPAAEVVQFSELKYSDPFDTSIASNILLGKTELKLLENELMSSTTNSVKSLTNTSNILQNNQFLATRRDIYSEDSEQVNVKPLTPISDQKDFDDDDIDPFDTSIASNIGPGRTELKLLESELI